MPRPRKAEPAPIQEIPVVSEPEADSSVPVPKLIELSSRYSRLKPAEADIASNAKLCDEFMLQLEAAGIKGNTDENRTVIPTGIDLLDTILGGGFGVGLTQLIGPAGSGKTALLAKCIATGQRKFAGKFMSVYIDSEAALTRQRLDELGVRYPKLNPLSNITIEGVFKIIEQLCVKKSKQPGLMEIPSIIGWDSIANTVTEAGMVATDSNSILAQKARTMSFYLPKYAPKLSEHNICLIAVNQMRDKLDLNPHQRKTADLRWMGDKTIPGGHSMVYNSIQIFKFHPKEDLKKNEEYGFDGLRVVGRMVKNKLFTPNIEIALIFSFSQGFSNFWTNFEMLKKYKRIRTGAWACLERYPERKMRQMQAEEMYDKDSQFREIFDEEVLDVLQKEFREPYLNRGAEDVSEEAADADLAAEEISDGNLEPVSIGSPVSGMDFSETI